MAKNRKSQSVAVRFGPAIKAVVICLLIGGSGVGYVWQKQQIVGLGRLMKDRENRLRRLEDLNDKQLKQLANMQSLQYLQNKIKELNLGLAPQQQSQVWHLPEPSGELAPAPERFYPLQVSRPLGGP